MSAYIKSYKVDYMREEPYNYSIGVFGGISHSVGPDTEVQMTLRTNIEVHDMLVRMAQEPYFMHMCERLHKIGPEFLDLMELAQRDFDIKEQLDHVVCYVKLKGYK
jgi:hypothetical protein